MTAIEARGVDFVLVPVRDLNRARTFYAALFDVAPVGCEHRAGAGAIGLHVVDAPAARAALEGAGAESTMEDLDSGVCLQACFSDSEGDALILHDRYAPRDRPQITNTDQSVRDTLQLPDRQGHVGR